MAILAGIDEAGYGPLLGPLVVSTAAMRVPDDMLKQDLWKVLRDAVTDRKKGHAGRLIIADSKKVYGKAKDRVHLQRAVIAALACIEAHKGREFVRCADLLSNLCPDLTERLQRYDWYKAMDGAKLDASSADVSLAAGVLARSLDKAGMAMCHMQAVCLDVGEYNRMIAAVKNKASVLFTQVARLIQTVFESEYAKQDGGCVHILIDQQGGRRYYRRQLARMFEGMELAVVKEDGVVSSYELAGRGRRMRVHFAGGADEKYLPVALASMTAKTVREILVSQINTYFRSFYPELKPTAGYWKDGQRFIRDLQTNLPNLTYQTDLLIRQK